MTTTTNSTMSLTDWLLLVVLSVLWGGAFFFVRVLVKDVPPFTVVLWRSGLAAIALLIYVVLCGNNWLSRTVPLILGLYGQKSVGHALAPFGNKPYWP